MVTSTPTAGGMLAEPEEQLWHECFDRPWQSERDMPHHTVRRFGKYCLLAARVRTSSGGTGILRGVVIV